MLLQTEEPRAELPGPVDAREAIEVASRQNRLQGKIFGTLYDRDVRECGRRFVVDHDPRVGQQMLGSWNRRISVHPNEAAAGCEHCVGVGRNESGGNPVRSALPVVGLGEQCSDFTQSALIDQMRVLTEQVTDRGLGDDP